jgi:putative ABC transport system substrate-binding protein
VKRRQLIAAGGAMLALPLAARAQSKTPVIGLLWNDSVKPSPYAATLLGALRERGYVVGRNLSIEDRVALEGYSPMAENAAALVRAKVDLIVTYGATATLAAAKATKEIPIVMIMGADPVARGLAASLSRPGGNVTGIATLTVGLIGKRIELLKELVPGLSRVGILLTPNVGNPVEARESEAAARALNLQPHFGEAHAPGDIERAIVELAKSRVGAVYMSGSTMLASHAARVAAIVAKSRIPAVYANERFVDAGGLMVYSPNITKAFGRIADYVDRILKGARAGELPIEQASEVELVINLKTAKALGLRIPQTILQRADRAID